MNIRSTGDVKLATEAALFASLLANGIPKDLGIHGDGAGQFNVFVRSLCWIHEERHYRKLIPSDNLKEKLNTAFDALFKNKTTTSPTLNHQLAKTYAKKIEFLRVLERPETPLHNNGTETDAREMVVKRKIPGGTRSEEGQKCRDTFISIKKTCMKLEICFLKFLEDRIGRLFEIPRLSQIILTRSAKQAS